MGTCSRKDAVDLWDLTRLLFRRWYFAVPVLLLTLASVLIASQTVQPDYSAKGHLQLIPPAHVNEPANAKDNRVHNPWLDLGIQALGQAAILKVQDERVLRQLVASGHSENFTVSIDYPTTFFSIEAIGNSPRQASNTVKEIMRLLSEDVRAEQQQFGVAEQDSVSTLALDEGDKVTVVTSKVKRVLIVAAGLGLLTTAASTIGLDALLRRRARRRAVGARTANAAGPPGDTGAAEMTSASEMTSLIADYRVNGKSHEPADATEALPKVSGTEALPKASGQVGKASVPAAKVRAGKIFTSKSAAQHDDDSATAIIAAPLVGEHAEAVDADRGPIVVEYHQGDERRTRDDDAIGDPPAAPLEDDAPAGVPVLSDATVVLPRSRGDWTVRDSRGNRS
jgi:hypothetical protein